MRSPEPESSCAAHTEIHTHTHSVCTIVYSDCLNNNRDLSSLHVVLIHIDYSKTDYFNMYCFAVTVLDVDSCIGDS